MDNKPTLYYQSDRDGFPLFPFCYSAAKGAREEGIEAKPIHTDTINQLAMHDDPYKIFVGSVETTMCVLQRNFIEAIDDSWASDFKRRKEEIVDIKDVNDFPCFIKPAYQIKAFTGFVAESKQELEHSARVPGYNISETPLPFEGMVKKQEVVNIESEYRVYVSNLRGVIGIKHYSGDPFVRLDEYFVDLVCKASRQHLSEQSYTLDFGIDEFGFTFLIEVNDGWAIGNYGLEPVEYYHFVKNRYLQLTGVIK